MRDFVKCSPHLPKSLQWIAEAIVTSYLGQEVQSTMIRVMLIDLQGEKSYIEYERVLPSRAEDFKCRLTGPIGVDYAREVAQEVAKGHVSGLTAGYRWYRQAGRN
jgi:hypothetical protein